jgi:hypothetical protein
MTLAQLLSQPLPALSVLRGMWIVFDATMADNLQTAQSDQLCHRAVPVPLTDGRMALCADLLSEIQSGGLFAVPFSRLDAGNFALVSVIDDEGFRSLLPVAEQP